MRLRAGEARIVVYNRILLTSSLKNTNAEVALPDFENNVRRVSSLLLYYHGD